MKKLSEINLREYVERKVEKLYYKGDTIEIITHYLNPERLKVGLCEEVRHIRRTVKFTGNKKVEERFCNIDIIDVGKTFLVTCCEHVDIQMEFKKGDINNYINNILVSGDLKCFLISKEDMYITYLLRRMEHVSKDDICNLEYIGIDAILLSSSTNLYITISISEEFVVKQLMILLNKDNIYDDVMKCNKYMVGIKPKLINVSNNVKDIIYRYDANVIPDNPMYRKEVILEEDIAIFTILEETPVTIFENTPIEYVVASYFMLPVGTQILIRNINHNVTIYLGSEDKTFYSKITTGFKMTTDIRITIYRPFENINEHLRHYFEKEISFSGFGLYEIFKKVLRDEFREKELLNII